MKRMTYRDNQITAEMYNENDQPLEIFFKEPAEHKSDPAKAENAKVLFYDEELGLRRSASTV
jgi:hypothetical protein